nr:hypothetical protein [Pseudomonas aeruginosa]
MGEPLVQPYEAPREKVNALFKVLGFSGTASVGDILDAALERLQAQPSPALPPFAEKVLAKLRRFYDCASDFESGGVDIGRHWLDLLTQLGLLNRVQRSPALWEISQQGEDLLGMPQPSPAQAEAERPIVSFEKYMQVMYDRDENAKRLDAALARVASLESKLAELEKQEPIGWWAQYCETPMRRMVHWGAKGPECTSEEFHPFYAAPFVKAQHSVPGKYDDVLLPFLKSMEHELHANAGKGNRPGWLQMDRRTALLEIYYHLAKLQKATKDNDAAGIVEYAADVANMSMMLVDVCGLLAAAPGKEVGHE